MGDSKTINQVAVTEQTHSWLVNQANRAGMKVGDFAGYLIERASTSYDWEKRFDLDNSPDLKILDLLTMAEMRKVRLFNIKKMAAIYIETGKDDERIAEWLEKACDEAGVNYDELIDRFEKDPFSNIAMASVQVGSKFSDCVTWLTNLMLEKKKIPSKEVLELAKDLFSETMVSRAKKYINKHFSSKLVIESQRIPGEHAWEFVLRTSDDIDDQIDDFETVSTALVMSNGNSGFGEM